MEKNKKTINDMLKEEKENAEFQTGLIRTLITFTTTTLDSVASNAYWFTCAEKRASYTDTLDDHSDLRQWDIEIDGQKFVLTTHIIVRVGVKYQISYILTKTSENGTMNIMTVDRYPVGLGSDFEVIRNQLKNENNNCIRYIESVIISIHKGNAVDR